MSGIPTITAYLPPARDAMPANTADWKVDPRRAVLLVHDMQHYFLRFLPGPLREAVVRNAATLRGRAADRGVPVAYTQQPGNMTEQQRGLLADFWGGGMSSAPQDRDVPPELAPGPRDWLVAKWRYSAFFSSDLLARMREAGRDQLVLCGVFAHIGVLATAIDAYAHDIQAFLVGDALGDFSEAEHLMALDYAARRCGMAVLTEDVFA